MHRSSDSVASIAMALAKAQTELCNPEWSAIGSIHHHNQPAPQAFRYAPLSSGLEIVRKTLKLLHAEPKIMLAIMATLTRRLRDVQAAAAL